MKDLSRFYILVSLIFLDTDFKFLLSDTDSIFLGLTKTGTMPENFESDFHGTWSAAFENIVKPEKRASWTEESKKFFVLDQKRESKRKPGNLYKS